MTEDERDSLAKLIVARAKANDRKGYSAHLAVAAALPPAEFRDVEGRVRDLGGASPPPPARPS